MKRWHEEYLRTHREWRKHYLSHVESNVIFNRAPGRDPYQIDCICDRQKGRFRKNDAWDCGQTQCYVCHSDKFPTRETTHQEKHSELKLREGMEEFLVDPPEPNHHRVITQRRPCVRRLSPPGCRATIVTALPTAADADQHERAS